jgi:hypothetical protein
MGAMFGGGVGRQTPPGKKEHYSGDWDSCLCSEHDGFRCPPLATNHDGFFAFLLGMRHVDAMAPVLAAGPDVWRIIHTLSHRATGYKEAKSVGGRYSASDLQFAWKTTKNCECHARDEHCTAHCQCLRRGACDNVPDHCTCAAGKCVALSCPCVSAGRPCNERCAVCGQHQQGKGEQQQPPGGGGAAVAAAAAGDGKETEDDKEGGGEGSRANSTSLCQTNHWNWLLAEHNVRFDDIPNECTRQPIALNPGLTRTTLASRLDIMGSSTECCSKYVRSSRVYVCARAGGMGLGGLCVGSETLLRWWGRWALRGGGSKIVCTFYPVNMNVCCSAFV